MIENYQIYAILQIETKKKLKMTIEEKIKLAKNSTSPETLDKLADDEVFSLQTT